MNDRENGERALGISVLAARHDDDDLKEPPIPLIDNYLNPENKIL